MTLDQLRYFVAAAKFEHVHKAAQSIPISPSVVSHAVKILEEELKCELFIRDRKRLRLTPRGVHLLELASQLLDGVDGLSKNIGLTEAPLKGHYRVGASHFLASKVVTPVWTELQKKFPKLTVELHSQPTWVLVDSILAGRLDFGLGFSPALHPHLEMEEVYRGISQVVVRKNHPILSRVKTHHYKFLSDYPATMHYATEKIFSSRHHPLLKAVHLDRNINFTFDSDFVAVENLTLSDNWSFMLDLVVRDFHKHLQIISVPKKSEAPYTIQIIRHRTKRVDAPMFEVFKLIKEQLSRMNGKVKE